MIEYFIYFIFEEDYVVKMYFMYDINYKNK